MITMTLSAQASPAAHPWTVEDLIQAETANDWAVSRDGSRAVWVQSEVRKIAGEEKLVSNLYLADLETGAAAQLTRGDATVSAPAFSPDGRHLAFLSDRDLPAGGGSEDKTGDTQLWVIPVSGGEAYPVTRLERSVRLFAWRSSRDLIFVAQESPSAWEQERKKQKDQAVVVDDYDREPPVRLFRVELEGEPERLSSNGDWIDELAVAPDGSRAVVRAQQGLSYAFYQRRVPRLYLVDLDSGAFEQLLEGSALRPGSLAWDPAGGGFYFAEERTNHPTLRIATVTDLYRYDLSTGAAKRVDLDWERGLGGEYLPVQQGLLALLADGVVTRPALYRKTGDGYQRQPLTGDHVPHIGAWAAASDGSRVVYAHSTANTPPQGYGARLEGTKLSSPVQLTKLNSDFKGKPTGRVEVIHWQGAGGDTVEGLLHWPLAAESDAGEVAEPAPLVVDIHGGPAWADRDTWDQRWSGPLLLWRQRGAFVLQVNYHGSSFYGLEWVESIRERYYEQERQDILSGVDELIRRGLVDEKRLGLSGWSNGGILTADLITVTDRFRAASVGAADVEWISDWANVDFGAAFDEYYFGGPPWERVEHYIEKSPFFRLTEVTTPTIVFTGTADRNVPPHQSWSLFRALQSLDRAPVRLVLFPGEPHGLQSIAHQRRKVEEEVAWFDRHLFAADEPRPEALPKGSLLAGLLARHDAATGDGGALGQLVDGRLIPETVPVAGLGSVAFEAPGLQAVGRFEVTRAQWAFYEDGAPHQDAAAEQAAEGNLPRTGISFEQAQAYVTWLAKLTGRPFRLPSKAEAEALAELAEGGDTGGNTLDFWLGYAPNPDDRATIEPFLTRLPGHAPLLLPVGQRGGAGEPPVFDLDGNAAEWAVAPDGTGVAVGPSADRSSDALHQGATKDPAYIGLRVVEGATGGSRVTTTSN
jgi:dipeptidyl aminopeptidase/acylaminoacyl peptidase